jgi:hypothetical protein
MYSYIGHTPMAVVKLQVRYLLIKNGQWFYQRRIPPALLSRYNNGKTHILESLQTRDLSVARKRIVARADRDNKLWADMRRDPQLMSVAVDHDARSLIEKWDLEAGRTPEWYEEGWFDKMQDQYGDAWHDLQVDGHSPQRRDELIERLVTPAERQAFRLLKPQAKSEPRLSDALAIYLEVHRKGHVDTKFTQHTTLSMNVAIDTLGNPTLASITRSDARKVRDAIKGVTSTVRRRLRVIVAVVNKAILELNLPITNPFKQLEIVDEGHDKDERKPFSPSEHVVIAEACRRLDDDVRWLMAILLDTGMRPREAVGLRVADVHLDTSVPYVHLRPHKERQLKTKNSEREGATCRCQPLGGSARHGGYYHAPLVPSLRISLWSQLE